jgi:hypothetical protein
MAVDKSVTRQENTDKIYDNETFDCSAQDVQEVNSTIINDMVVDGSNVGSETEVFKGRNDGTGNDGILEFRTLKAGPNVSLSLDGDSVLITGTTSPGGDIQDLQSVLNEGAVATIDGMFSVTAGGSNLYILPNLLGYTYSFEGDSSSMSVTGGSFGCAGASATASHAFTSSPIGIVHDSVEADGTTTTVRVGEQIIKMESDNGGVYSKHNQTPQGITIESDDNTGSGGFLQAAPWGFKAAIKSNFGSPKAMSIIGNPDDGLGFKVSREYAPTNDAAALWDIDGDLRIREASTSTSTKVLVREASGLVGERDVVLDTEIKVNQTNVATTLGGVIRRFF